jgi:hypothetical protein
MRTGSSSTQVPNPAAIGQNRPLSGVYDREAGLRKSGSTTRENPSGRLPLQVSHARGRGIESRRSRNACQTSQNSVRSDCAEGGRRASDEANATWRGWRAYLDDEAQAVLCFPECTERDS